MKKGRKESSVRYYKPLSKEEASAVKKAGVSEDEYRYRQACTWAIMMGEQIPEKKRFMADLAKKRSEREKAARAAGFRPTRK